jgi:hypothetical protein
MMSVNNYINMRYLKNLVWFDLIRFIIGNLLIIWDIYLVFMYVILFNFIVLSQILLVSWILLELHEGKIIFIQIPS